jgi:arylformamidase
MELHFSHNRNKYCADLTAGRDLTIRVSPEGPRAWYVPRVRISPVLNQHFTGSVAFGGQVNFNDIFFNPHGHGTHTETMGHITKHSVPIAEVNTFFFPAQLITVTPEICQAQQGTSQIGDHIITAHQIRMALNVHSFAPEAVLLRTMPNAISKLHRNYSNTNFPYLESAAAAYMADHQVNHLLVDIPSVDREEDGGKLAAHHHFWKNGDASRSHCTITEMIFIPDDVADGNYLVQIVPAAFENDAAPSRILIYPLR